MYDLLIYTDFYQNFATMFNHKKVMYTYILVITYLNLTVAIIKDKLMCLKVK